MKIKELTKIALFVAIITVCSYITVPFTGVPFTLQTFAIFLACFVLGWKNATVGVGVYILLGMVGVPVFSGFKGGIGAIAGPTGGYIIGFLAQCLVYGLITVCFGKRGEKAFVRIFASVVGLAVLYIFGTIWFAYLYTNGGAGNFAVVLMKCVVPFIIPDLAKMSVAFVVAERLNKSLAAGNHA